MTFEIDDSTVFVLGNGPSLKAISFEKLTGVASIGMNAAYRYWRKIDWRPTYYACLDEIVGLSHKSEIASLIAEGRIKKFLLRQNLIEALNAEGMSEKVCNFDELRKSEDVLKTPSVTTGSGAACWASVLGYRKVVIAGVDLNYVEIVDGAHKLEGAELEIQHQNENPNCFFKDYQQPGDRYNIPNTRPDLHLNAWREAAWLLDSKQVQAVNVNIDSEVKCFPYVQLHELMIGKAKLHPAREPLTEYTVAGLAKLAYKLKAEKDWFVTERKKLLLDLGKKKGELAWYQEQIAMYQEQNAILMKQRSLIRQIASRLKAEWSRRNR